jgi:hypothetical protein
MSEVEYWESCAAQGDRCYRENHAALRAALDEANTDRRVWIDRCGAAAQALAEVGKRALVVKPTLDQPYRDDPSQTPWTRFMERPAREAYNLGAQLRSQVRHALAGEGSDDEN